MPPRSATDIMDELREAELRKGRLLVAAEDAESDVCALRAVMLEFDGKEAGGSRPVLPEVGASGPSPPTSPVLRGDAAVGHPGESDQSEPRDSQEEKELHTEEPREWASLPRGALDGLGLANLGHTVEDFRVFFGQPASDAEASVEGLLSQPDFGQPASDAEASDEGLLSQPDFVPHEDGCEHVLPDGQVTRVRMRKVGAAFELEWLI